MMEEPEIRDSEIDQTEMQAETWYITLLKQPIVFGGVILFLMFLGGNWILSQRQAEAHVATLNLTPSDHVVWDDDLVTAEAEARRQNKPVFIDFGATWCGPCQHMQNEVFSDPRVSGILTRFICVHIDIDKDPSDAQAFGVQGIPRIIVQTPQRETRMDIVGSREADPFAQQLSDAVGLPPTASTNVN